MGKRVIVLAEDEPTIRDAVKEILDDNFELHMAENGKILLEILKKVKPDVILLDVMMPVMGGIEACKIIKNDEDTSKIPVIFLTAKGQITDVEKGFKVGADSYIVKPFSAGVLMQKLDTILSKVEVRKRMQAENSNSTEQ
ncbi:MAG: hypothetical protein CVV21_01350 [Candidatus Goldiibacteriota bacterium HGW-Goldbacteria-1]|jgi:DNA-binding response OmpR family regulator|nr:MAG: hypothetical protein CVV21_01350 [Candidatus Goldiibacteriota bacterium HGW-Goldbacteria-1]